MSHFRLLLLVLIFSSVIILPQGAKSYFSPDITGGPVFRLSGGTENTDTLKTYYLSPVEITSSRIKIGESQFPVEKDNLSNLIGQNGFSLIRKGVFFAQDIYADGMKRGEITVVVDGERYHSACPNRMDSPLSRVNPLDLESIDLTKTSATIQSGLGGMVNFHRAVPGIPFLIKGGITASAGALNSYDGAVALEKLNHRLSLRYAKGNPYMDANSRSFKDLYGYENNSPYSLGEVSFQGKADDLKYGTTFSYTENVSFPYLKMDERKNRVFSSFISYKENKLYVNYTDHLMNNALRLRQPGSLMETDARNLTVGLIGDFYEFYYRNWNADNIIVMQNNMSRINNKLMPHVNMYSASLQKTLTFNSISLSGKAGAVYYTVGDKERLDFYRVLYPDSKANSFFPTFGLSLSYIQNLPYNFAAGVLLETASEAPETENMFVAVTRPKGNPTWTGNPQLKQPLRATARGIVLYEKVQLELYATHIWNYTNLSKAAINQTSYMTYGNVNALMLGSNLSLNWRYLEVMGSYIWAENRSNSNPLAEIAPLKVSTKLKSPEFLGFNGYLKHTYNNAQTRVDLSVFEKTTPAWNRFDLGINYSISNVQLSLEAENITNEQYYQHLSYMRDPFASGAIVFEPGRLIRLSIRLNEMFE